MIVRFMLIFLLGFPLLRASNPFETTGYVEICDQIHEASAFEALYAQYDALIEFLQKHPSWSQKMYAAKERFLRSKERQEYSTDYFGFYDESEREGRRQIAFYYAPHFHDFLHSHYPESNQIPEITHFLDACRIIQESCPRIFDTPAAEMGLSSLSILLKVVKYLPSYTATKPHYDGTAFSLFLNSTDNASLLLSPYRSTYSVKDFVTPVRECSSSLLLIPGVLLTEFSVYPTPHIVVQSGQTRYATIAFAMRPHFMQPKIQLAPLPDFKD